MLLRGYAAGIFPMADSRDASDIFWVEPRTRAIIPLDRFHLSRSLARRLRSGQFRVTCDRAFHQVLLGCADRDETWINAAIERAKLNDNGRPKLIIARTEIGRGIPEVAGTAKAHGESGAKFAASARRGLGLPDELFYVSDLVREYFTQHARQQRQRYDAWQVVWNQWRQANPELARQLDDGIQRRLPADLVESIPAFAADYRARTVGRARRYAADEGELIDDESELVLSRFAALVQPAEVEALVDRLSQDLASRPDGG